MTVHVIGDGVAGLATARALNSAGADVVVHGDRQAHGDTYMLVHRHAGRSFRTTPLGDDAWAAAVQWFAPLVEHGSVSVVRMARPAGSRAGARLRRSLEHAEHVCVEQHPTFGECFMYEPAFVVHVASALRDLTSSLVAAGVVFERHRADIRLPGAVLAIGEQLDAPRVSSYGGHLVEFEGELGVAVSGGGIHAVPTAHGMCVGATFWPATEPMSDAKAVSELRDRAAQLGLAVGKTLKTWSGYRAVNDFDRRPVVGWRADQFVVGAFGTRGWFWAALAAQEASKAILEQRAVRSEFAIGRVDAART